MKITQKQARGFINAIKAKNPKMHQFECRLIQRKSLGYKEPGACNELNDTDYFDDFKCDASGMQWLLQMIYKQEHPNIIDMSLYSRGRDSELIDHVWIEFAKEQYEKFISGQDFKTGTTRM